MVYFALQSLKQWSTCKVNSINYRYKKLVKTASNTVVINDLDSLSKIIISISIISQWLWCIASNAQNHKIYNKVKLFIITENID